jgi:hypothetical protein
MHTDDVGDLKRPQEVSMGHVADPDSGDQPFLPRGYQGAELVDKPFVQWGVVQEAQVDRGESLDTERHKIVLDARAKLIRVVVGQVCAELVPAATDLADQRQVVGVGEKRFPDQLIHQRGTVVLGGVDVIDAGLEGRPQHGDCFIAVPGWTEYSGAGQLHGAVPDPPHHFVG